MNKKNIKMNLSGIQILMKNKKKVWLFRLFLIVNYNKKKIS